MKKITKEAWEKFAAKACEMTNAVMAEDDVLTEVYRQQIHELLDELEVEFGKQSILLDTRGDFSEDPQKRRRLYMKALKLAREEGDQEQIEIVRQSLRDLAADEDWGCS